MVRKNGDALRLYPRYLCLDGIPATNRPWTSKKSPHNWINPRFMSRKNTCHHLNSLLGVVCHTVMGNNNGIQLQEDWDIRTQESGLDMAGVNNQPFRSLPCMFPKNSLRRKAWNGHVKGPDKVLGIPGFVVLWSNRTQPLIAKMPFSLEPWLWVLQTAPSGVHRQSSLHSYSLLRRHVPAAR